MSVEAATYISQLDATNPPGGGPKSEGDDHLRLLKAALKAQFPNFGAAAMNATTAELNFCVGVTSLIQTQLDSKGAKAGQVWTGAHDFTGATLAIANATLSSQPYTKAQVDALVISATAPTFSPSTTAVSKTLVDHEQCAVTAAGQTISLPAAPTAGVSICRIRTRAGITTTVGRNGNKIQGLAEDMKISRGNLTVTLGYQDSTDGWVLL